MLEYILTDDGSDIIREDLCKRLQAGQVGIVPTETTYGLVCLASNDEGRRRIAEMKKRDNHRAMQFLVDSLDNCSWLDVDITPEMRKLSDAFWPGPMTLIVTNATGDYISIRVPRNDFLCGLINQLEQPLSASSAAVDLKTGLASLSEEPDFVVINEDGQVVPSTVIRLHHDGTYEILQEGTISASAVKEALEA